MIFWVGIVSSPFLFDFISMVDFNKNYLDITLLLSLKVAVKGGPTVGVHIVYASSDETIATVHQSSGRLFGIVLGNTVSDSAWLIL